MEGEAHAGIWQALTECFVPCLYTAYDSFRSNKFVGRLRLCALRPDAQHSVLLLSSSARLLLAQPQV